MFSDGLGAGSFRVGAESGCDWRRRQVDGGKETIALRQVSV